MASSISSAEIRRRLLLQSSITPVALLKATSVTSLSEPFDILASLKEMPGHFVLADRNDRDGRPDRNHYSRPSRDGGDRGPRTREGGFKKDKHGGGVFNKGGGSGDKEDRFDVAPRDIDLNNKKEFMIFQYRPKNGGQPVKLDIRYKDGDAKLKRDANSNIFFRPTETSASDTLKSRVTIEKSSDGLKLQLEIHPKDYYVIRPNPQKNIYELYSPYLGHQFHFILKDTGIIRYRKFLGVTNIHDNNNIFAQLSENSIQLSPLENSSGFLRRAISQFDQIQERIGEEFKEHSEKIQEKRSRFKFRVGDVATNVANSTKDWLIARILYDRAKKSFYYILVLDEGDNLRKEGVALEDVTVIQKIPDTNTIDPLKYYPNVQYVRTVEDDLLRRVQTNLNSKFEQVVNVLGLNPKDSIRHEERRDRDIEMTPKPREQTRPDNSTNLGPGKIFYIKDLPKQKTSTFTPMSDEDYKMARQKIEAENPLDKVDRLRNLDVLRNTHTAQSPRDIKFPSSEGWYLISSRTELKDSNLIRWAIIPYPLHSRQIKAIVPVPRVIHQPVFNGGQSRSTVTFEDKAVDYAYVVLDLPKSGEGSLDFQVTSFADTNGQVVNVRQLKPENKKDLERAQDFVKKRDIAGNSRKVEPGDLVEYKGKQYYVTKRKQQGSRTDFLIAPLAAFVDLQKSNVFSMPFKFVEGGTPAIGYESIIKDSEGPESFDMQAHKIATADSLENTNIKDLFLKFYSNYEPDGTPRSKPMDRNRIAVDQSGPKKDRTTEPLKPDQIILDKPTTSDAPVSKPVGQAENDIHRDKVTSTKLMVALSNGQVKLGSIIQYNWGNVTSSEILYEVMGESIRIVAGYQGYSGPPNGVVPIKGYVDAPTYGNIKKSGFWPNFFEDFYSNNSIYNFIFPVDFEDNFKQTLRTTGSRLPIPENTQRKADQEKIDGIATRKKYEIFQQNGYVNNFLKNIMDHRPIGRVIEYERDGEVIRSVISKTLIIGKDIGDQPALFKITVYPDIQNRGRTQVPIMNIVGMIDPKDVDPNFERDQEMHKAMKENFEQNITKDMPPDVADYYKNYFHIIFSRA